MSIQKLRRCHEPRWDFEHTEGNIWPMRVQEGGDLYGFCPGKAFRDAEAMLTFRLLVVSAETGAMYNEGGISNQPEWFIDLLSWFLPVYDTVKFYAKVKGVVGDGGGKTASKNPSGRQRGGSQPRKV